ncbi:MAG: putative polysaccharide export transporter permease protein, partial [Candidatus Saccharibacteria bacterium]|nr:putative polysaccharide export transporter permease protein [Candidatus Saccharibacteria bacterium]
KLLLLNPMAQAIQDIRYHAITPATDTISKLSNHWYIEIIPFVIVIITLITAVVIFKKMSPKFAEEV